MTIYAGTMDDYHVMMLNEFYAKVCFVIRIGFKQLKAFIFVKYFKCAILAGARDDNKDGIFLVRDSSTSPGDYVLSVLHQVCSKL